MDFIKLGTIAAAIAKKDNPAAIVAINRALLGETGVNWIRDLTSLASFLKTGKPAFIINSYRGNSKLPFMAFSALPGKSFCPGAGDCLKQCFSFKSWRNPGAFCRQAQNTVLLGTKAGQQIIKLDFQRIIRMRKYNNSPIFRLYVDGDFQNISDVRFWFNLLSENSGVRAYGYTKSFHQVLAYAKNNALPYNYKLNVSAGHKHKKVTVNKIKALSITRGDFVYIPMDHIIPAGISGHSRAQIQKEFIKTTGKKAFVCPGDCGNCVKVKNVKSHFCGSDNKTPIVIAMH